MRTIRKQMTITLVLGIAIILGIFVFLTIQRLSTLPAMMEFDKQEIANARADEISRELNSTSNYVASLANSNIIRSMDMPTIQAFLPSLEGQHGIRNFTIADPSGSAWTTYDQTIDISEQEQYHAIFNEGHDTHISMPFFSPFIPEDAPILTVAHAIKNDDGETIGLLNAVISTEFLDEVISEINYLSSGYAYIVASNGSIITHPNPEININYTLADIFDSEEDYTALLSMSRGAQTHMVEGTKEFVVYTPIEHAPEWIFILALDYQEAFGEYYSIVTYLRSGAVFALVLVIVFAMLYATSITKPLLRLMHTFKEAASGNLNIKADESVKNELGLAGAHFNQMINQIKELTYSDTVTGLYNYNSFLIEAKYALKTVTTLSKAIIIISIDDFKRINSLGGYDVGNALLRKIAETLQNFTTEDEIIGRYFGDEIIVLLASESNKVLAERIETLNSLFIESFILEHNAFHVSVSIGVSYIEENQSLNDYVYKASIAKSVVKKEGGNNIAYYNHTMNQAILEEKALEDALFDSIENNNFELHFQAVTNQVGKIVGYESLLRYNHKDFKDLPIPIIIEALEKRGLINKVGDYIIKESLRALKQLKTQNSELFITINVSVLQLEQADFVKKLAAHCKEEAIEPSDVWIEITETHAMQNVEHKIKLLTTLSNKGFKIAIDDFGTGYSSLAYFSTFPINALKIDKRFVASMDKDPNALSIVKTIISMAKNMRIILIAEGVETKSQKDQLIELGCDHCQGYYFMKPAPLQMILK